VRLPNEVCAFRFLGLFGAGFSTEKISEHKRGSWENQSPGSKLENSTREP